MGHVRIFIYLLRVLLASLVLAWSDGESEAFADSWRHKRAVVQFVDQIGRVGDRAEGDAMRLGAIEVVQFGGRGD